MIRIDNMDDTIKNTLVLFVAIIMFFIVMEAIIRLGGNYEYTHQGITDQEGNGIYLEDPVLGYKIKPNFKGRLKSVEFDTEIITNSDGFRTEELGKGIYVLGDSQTMGYGVEQNDTFTYHISQLLKRNVYNLGVSGYSTKQELELAKRIVKEKEVEKLIVIFYLGNDVHENCGIIKREINKQGFKTGRTGFISKLKKLRVLRFIYSKTYNIYHNQISNKSTEAYTIECLRETEKILKEFSELDVNKIFVLLPSKFQIYNDIERIGALKNMFKDNNITFIDLSKSFRYDMYYKHDNHLNKDGHRILSLELYDILWG